MINKILLPENQVCQVKKNQLLFTAAPPGVKCVRPGNPSCAHPTTCSKNKKCYYNK